MSVIDSKNVKNVNVVGSISYKCMLIFISLWFSYKKYIFISFIFVFENMINMFCFKKLWPQWNIFYIYTFYNPIHCILFIICNLLYFYLISWWILLHYIPNKIHQAINFYVVSWWIIHFKQESKAINNINSLHYILNQNIRVHTRT